MPAYVSNAAPIFQRSNWLSFKRRVAVTVRFGLPLPPPPDPDDSRSLRQYTRQIMQAIGELAQGDPTVMLESPATGELDGQRAEAQE